jgi:uncharacterized membrane protein YkvI
MNKINKILNIVTYVIIAITVVFIGLFYLGGEVPNQAQQTPVHTDEMLIWGYILFAIACGAAVLFGVVKFFMNIKEAKKGLISLGAIAAVVVISYMMSDTALLDLPGYTGSDNTPATLEFADTILFSTYCLGFGAIVAIIATEIIRKVR